MFIGRVLTLPTVRGLWDETAVFRASRVGLHLALSLQLLPTHLMHFSLSISQTSDQAKTEQSWAEI